MRQTVTLKESEIVDDILAQCIRTLLNDSARLEQMSTNIRALAPHDAAKRVVETMERYSNHEVRV
jgi:UDP-N-acetylglucosamine:LPS N-acetylglucosamine transferase